MIFAKIVFFLFFILPILGFGWLILRIINKVKTEQWRGKITDKLYNTREDEPRKTEQFFTLVVQTEAGQTRKIAVTKAMYDSCQVGDTLEKPKGALNPIKV